MAKHRFLNTAAGPRGVNLADGGYFELAPGQAATLDVSDSELKAAERAGYFDIGKAGSEPSAAASAAAVAAAARASGSTALDRDGSGAAGGSLPNNAMKLRSIAKGEDIDLGTARTVPELQAAIVAGRQAKAAAASGSGAGGSDDLDTLDDNTLLATVAAMVGKPVDSLPTDRGELLELARGVGQ